MFAIDVSEIAAVAAGNEGKTPKPDTKQQSRPEIEGIINISLYKCHYMTYWSV